MKKLFKEFKEFISRGNVLDLAVGMIIGAAFTAIVTSLVNYVLKPLIAWIPLGNTDGFKTVLREAYINAEGVEVPELAIQWSEVISAIITFLLTAIILFAIVKVINTAKKAAEKAKAELEAKKKAEEEAVEVPAEPEPEPVPPAPTQEELLAEILEELKKQNK